jgi:hypothetical protein
MKLCWAYVCQYTVHQVLDLSYNFNISKKTSYDISDYYCTSFLREVFTIMIQSAWQPFCLLYKLHLANIFTVQRRVRGYNHRKLFAQKSEECQRVSSKRINNDWAHCTSDVCFEVILRGSWIVSWQVRLTLEYSEAIKTWLHVVIWRAQSPFKCLPGSYAEGCVLSFDKCSLHSRIIPRSFTQGCISSFEERNRHSKVFRGYFCRVGT